MTRTETIAQIQSSLVALPDERLQALAAMVQAWSRPTVFSTLSAADRADLDAAVDSPDRGEGVALDDADTALESRLRAARV